MKETLVSIIVPVHNAGQYLSRCLDSLVNQTLREIEIILVLDCPTDGSDKVALEYAKYDTRIKIIENQANLHIGNSRNEGLKIAKGKYVGFSDHDDYADSKMYEMLYNKAEKEELDLVCSPYVAVNGGEIIVSDDFPIVSNEEFVDRMYECTIGAVSEDDPSVFTLGTTIWKNLYRLDIIRTNHISFIDTRYSSAEDRCFLLDYLSYINRAGYVSTILYYHLWGVGNAGATLSYLKIEKTISYLNYMKEHLMRLGVFAKYRKRWENTVRLRIVTGVYLEYKKTGFSSLLKNVRIIKRSSAIKAAFTTTTTIPYYLNRNSKDNRKSKFLKIKEKLNIKFNLRDYSLRFLVVIF